MFRFTLLIIAIMMSIIVAAGCSSGKAPVAPSGSGDDLNLDLPSNTVENRHLLGAWNLEFDADSLSTEVSQKRDAGFHLDIKTMIPSPGVVITGYDPLVNVMDIDVTIANPNAFNGYDLRLIVFTNTRGIKLVNPDNWTALWDIPGGSEINPFRAFAKDVDNRLFAAYANHTERIQLEFPTGIAPVAIAIDASWPGNCEEPYEMKNFKQTNLYSVVDSWSSVRIDVYDWQEDIADVDLFCPSILGGMSLPFSIIGNYSTPYYSVYPHTWGNTLKNNTGIGAGNYLGYVQSKSENSGELSLYEIVNIAVSDGDPIPHDPLIISQANGPSTAYDIDIEGDFAYLLSPYNMCVIDISDPLESAWMGEAPISMPYPTGLVFEDNAAYVTTARWTGTEEYESVVEKFDVSDPFHPTSDFSIDLLYAQDVDAQGDYLYIADYTDGLKIIDLTIPGVVGQFSTNEATDVLIDGDMLYLADKQNGIGIFNVADRTNPLLLGVCNMVNPNDIALQDDYLFVADGSEGMKIYDVSDPFNPLFLGFTENFYARKVDVQGDYAYVVDSNSLHAFDISDKDHPILISTTAINSGVYDVVVVDNFAYVATSNKGLVIVKLW